MFLTAKNLNHPGIRHGFFTCRGGVSTGGFAELNVGYGSGEGKDIVQENRRRVAKALGSPHDEIVTCYQVHSNICHYLNTPPLAGGLGGEALGKNNASPLNPPASGGKLLSLEGDALVTKEKGVAIAMLTADCVPVLLADAEAGIIGAVHAGWRGAHAGIAINTINEMLNHGAAKERLIAAIGPAISQASFEVGTDVKEAFTELDPTFANYFLAGKDAEHFQCDLTGIVRQQILSLGVANIEKLDYDTYAREDLFYSYRRACHKGETQYGRQCSAIMLA